jgi:predicted transcriptional regulator
MPKKSPATVQLDPRTLRRLDGLARARSKSREWLVQRAVEHFLDYEKWFEREVKAGLRDLKTGRVVEHEEIVKKWERRREDYLESRRRP